MSLNDTRGWLRKEAHLVKRFVCANRDSGCQSVRWEPLDRQDLTHSQLPRQKLDEEVVEGIQMDRVECLCVPVSVYVEADIRYHERDTDGPR